MADEERPPAPPIRVASTKDSVSPASKPLPSAPEKKKTKAFTFFQNKGDERSMLFFFIYQHDITPFLNVAV